MGLKDIGVTTLTFQGHVTSSTMSSFVPPLAISHSGHFLPSLYLKPFFRYLHLNISRLWLRPFWVTWRHRSRHHSILHTPFPTGAPL